MQPMQSSVVNELRFQSRAILGLSDPAEKVAQTHALQKLFHSDVVGLDTLTELTCLGMVIPGRPVKPELVPPLEVKRRSMATKEGRAALLHALCHIEFNAIKKA